MSPDNNVHHVAGNSDVDMTDVAQVPVALDNDHQCSPSSTQMAHTPNIGLPSTNPNDQTLTFDSSAQKFVVAVDFGTTFSSVAYARFKIGTDPNTLQAEDVKCVDNYPNIPAGAQSSSGAAGIENVPTKLWYRENTPMTFDPDALTRGSPLSDASSDMSDDGSMDSFECDWQNSSPDTSADLIAWHTTPARDLSDLAWGFEVDKAVEAVGVIEDRRRVASCFKLTLDSKSTNTAGLREQATQNSKFLKKQGLIKHTDNIISDYLEKLLGHARQWLRDYAGLTPQSAVEFVITVPNIWTQSACQVMHDAMAVAIANTRFGRLTHGSIDNLYIVNEPEAAAEYVLDDPGQDVKIRAGETILIVDAGGGTVDTAMYKITGTAPLRLEQQAVEPDGAPCGSSYIDREYRSHLQERLRGSEKDIVLEAGSLDAELDSLTVAWTHSQKLMIDTTSSVGWPLQIYIRGLKANAAKGFTKNHMVWTQHQVQALFRPSLHGVKELVTTQLELAAGKKIDVSKVILVGGFAASPSLYNYLRKFLQKQRSFTSSRIELIRPMRYVTSAVGRGAVLRALRKKHGPKRICRASLGFLRTEQHDPDQYDAHKGIRPRYDRVDGQRWVGRTIYWVIKKGDAELAHFQELPRLRVCHTFKLDSTRLLCEEILYVSEHRQESHFRIGHAENKGKAREMARIIADMSFLLDAPGVDITATDIDAKTGKEKKYYKIEMDLVMIVDGRNLRFEARYENGQYRKVTPGQVSLAFAFEPGTV